MIAGDHQSQARRQAVCAGERPGTQVQNAGASAWISLMDAVASNLDSIQVRALAGTAGENRTLS